MKKMSIWCGCCLHHTHLTIFFPHAQLYKNSKKKMRTCLEKKCQFDVDIVYTSRIWQFFSTRARAFVQHHHCNLINWLRDNLPGLFFIVSFSGKLSSPNDLRGIHKLQPCYVTNPPPAGARIKSIFVQKGHATHPAFRADFSHVVLASIARPKIEGSQS